MAPIRNQPNCHCAVCYDGYSNLPSASGSATRGVHLPGARSSSSSRSECLAGSPEYASRHRGVNAHVRDVGGGGGGLEPPGAGGARGAGGALQRGSGAGAAYRTEHPHATHTCRWERDPDAPRPYGSGPGRPSVLAEKYLYPELAGELEVEGQGQGSPVDVYGDLAEGALRPGEEDVDVDVEDTSFESPVQRPDQAAVPAVDLERCDSDLHKVHGRVEPYLPQPEDDCAPAGFADDVSQAGPRLLPELRDTMEPVGPWAQGRPDWGPLAGLTGTRPAVDRHSITRYSVPEWRKHNLDTFERAGGDNHNAGMVDFNGHACMQHVAAEADKNQLDSTARLEQRAMDLHRWLGEVRRAHQALWEEMRVLEPYRPRLRRLLCTLTKCGAVAGECLQLRALREEPDLVRDEPEEEVVKEIALVAEVKGLMERTLAQVEEQQAHNRAAKTRLSANWSDKNDAYEIDSLCAGLPRGFRDGAPTALFREGATRFPDSQSTPESWEAASREDICLSENERAKSAMLRNLADAMIADSARDLQRQEARVDQAVKRRVQVVVGLLHELENQLALINRRIVETERLIEDLKKALRQLDVVLKVAQSRLHSRLDRKRVENARDRPQYGLVDEVKSISEQCSALLGQLQQAQDCLQSLQDTRRHLEREIVCKRKNLYLDRDRFQRVRQHYPPGATLTGLH